MNIKCNHCSKGFRIYVQELVWQSKLKVRVEGFRCPHCKHIYITKVTDNALRDSLYQERELKRQIQHLNVLKSHDYDSFKRINRDMPEYKKLYWENKIMTAEEELSKISNYNKRRGRELKEWYMRKEA